MSVVKWLACLCVLAGSLILQAQDLSSDKHHVLLLRNDVVRVYRLKLAQGEATKLHLHSHPYAYLTLQDAHISNEVPGHKPKVVDVSAGDVHISKGGFHLVERNVGESAVDEIVVEQLGIAVQPFADKMADFRVFTGALGNIFEEPGMRAYALRLLPGGKTQLHPELHDRLLVALTDAQLVDSTDGQTSTALPLKTGDVKWLPKGGQHSLSNTGDVICSFVTFEFAADQ